MSTPAVPSQSARGHLLDVRRCVPAVSRPSSIGSIGVYRRSVVNPHGTSPSIGSHDQMDSVGRAIDWPRSLSLRHMTCGPEAVVHAARPQRTCRSGLVQMVGLVPWTTRAPARSDLVNWESCPTRSRSSAWSTSSSRTGLPDRAVSVPVRPSSCPRQPVS